MSKFVRLAGGVAAGTAVALAAWYLLGDGQQPPVDPVAVMQPAQQDGPQADEVAEAPQADPAPITAATPADQPSQPSAAQAPEAADPTPDEITASAETTPAEPAETTAETDPEQPAEVTDEPGADPSGEITTETATSSVLSAPAFDEVRRESDGMTIIAGTAAPGAAITIQMDGASVASATADGAGKFATIVMLAPDGFGHVLTLLQTRDGQEVASADQIILAPLDPVVVAEVVPETTPEIIPAPVDGTTATPEAAAVALSQLSETAGGAASDSADPAPQPDAQAATKDPAPQQAQSQEPLEIAEAAVADAPDVAETVAATAVDPAPASGDVQAPAEAGTPETPQVATTAEIAGSAAAPAAQPAGVLAPAKAEAPELPPLASADEPTATAPSADTPTAIAEAPPAPQAPSVTADAAAPAPQPAPETATAAPKSDSQQVAVLKATRDGVELLGTEPPAVMDNVALDTISYSDKGDIELAGRAQPDTRNVQIYLDNSAVISLEVDADGRWRGKLPNVEEGVYELRVDEVAEDGSVTSRVQTPFKRESPAELAAAAAASQDGPLRKITVQKGDTLWAISRDRYGDGLLYVKVFRANEGDIRDPDLIYPGQVFDLPD